MPPASARRSFHGPLLVTSGAAELRRQSGPLSLLPAPAHGTPVGRALLEVAREAAATTNQRERILAGVLAALRNLTGARL